MDIVENDPQQIENEEKEPINDANSLEATSIYAPLYKAKTFLTQTERRRQLLEAVKLRRNKTIDEKRGVVEEPNSNVEEEPVDAINYRRRTYKKSINYKLMLSEWFTEIPSDLESKWIVKLCPWGKRYMVVAHEKYTNAFNIRGKMKRSFNSDLPGGGPQSSNSSTLTVLDCIFDTIKKCFFVLDVVIWNSNTVQYCDANFRFYWLKTKLSEIPELKQKSVYNNYPFFEIESFPSELPMIHNKLSFPLIINDEQLELDGVLFYHEDSDYTPGRTPLVGWLKPYMIPEMLNIPVYSGFLTKKPKNYISLHEYVKKLQLFKKAARNNKFEVHMDVTPIQ